MQKTQLDGPLRLKLLGSLVMLPVVTAWIYSMNTDWIESAIIIWLLLVLMVFLTHYLMLLGGRIWGWVLAGFPSGRPPRVLRPVLILAALTVVLLACAYLRYGVIEVREYGHGYHYLVIDRWTGDVKTVFPNRGDDGCETISDVHMREKA